MRFSLCLAALFFAVANGAVVSKLPHCELDYACQNYTTARICNNKETCREMYWTKSVSDDDLCTQCKDEVSKVQTWLEQKKTRTEIYDDLIKFCQMIPLKQLSGDCRDLVVSDFQSIYDDLVAMLDSSTVCTALGLCNKITNEKYANQMIEGLPQQLLKALEENRLPMAAPIKVESEESCSGCEEFLHEIREKLFGNDQFLADKLNIAHDACSQLEENTEVLACKEYLEMFTSTFSEMGKQNSIDMKYTCKSMMMCDRFQAMGDICTDCKTFFSEWQQMLKDNQTLVDQVVKIASSFYCLQKPVELREQCVRYVSMVIKVFLDKMEREDVGKICRELEFCQAPTLGNKLMRLMPAIQQHLTQGVNGDHCTDCKNFITDLQDAFVNNPQLVQEIEDLVKQECAQLGEELKPICEDYVKDNFKKLVNETLSKDVNTICSTIEMCTSSAIAPKIPKQDNGDICNDCIAFFGDWQDIIANNKSVIEKQLQLFRDEMCETFPFFVRGKCKEEFDKYSEEAMDKISKTDPSEVCATLYFCDAKSSFLPKFHAELEVMAKQSPKVNIDVECGICQSVVAELEHAIENNSTEAELEKLLQDVCDLYGEDIKDQCKAFMVQYGPEVIDFLIQMANMQDICKMIGLCKDKMIAKVEKVVEEKAQIPVVCEACKALVEYVVHEIENNKTEAKVREALERACALLPSKYRTECDEIVDKYSDEILRLLLEVGFNPNLICNAIGLCTGPLSKENAIEKCEVCDWAVGEVVELLENTQVESDIAKELTNLCKHFGSKAESCEKFVNENLPTILEVLAKKLEPGVVCSFLKMCPKESIKAELQNNLECTACEALAKALESKLSANSTEKEIRDVLDSVCNDLGSFKDTCIDLVNTYSEAIIELLMEEFSPGTLCVDLKLCPKTVEANGIVCDVCKKAADQLESMLKNDKTKKSIREALTSACMGLPDDLQSKCKKIACEFDDQIINELINRLNSDALCKAIKLCPATSNVATSPEDCKACKTVAKEVQDVLSDSATEQVLKVALEQLCNVFGDAADECDSIVEIYTRKLVEFLVKEMDPDKVCKELKLCVTVELKEVEPVENDISCDVCKAVFLELDNLLAENATEEEIKQALEEVCGILPASMKDECNQLVEQYSDTIVQLLIEELKPDHICQELKLCSTGEVELVKKIEENLDANDISCDVCKTVFEELDNLLAENATEVEIKLALEEVCGILPSSIKDECDQLVEQYADTIVQLLIEQLKPDQICKELKLCTSLKVEVAKKIEQIPTSAITCDICQAVARELDNMLSKGATKDDIEKALKSVCGRLPSQYKDKCDAIVQEYTPLIIMFLVEEMAPSKLCAKLKLCDSERKMHVETGEKLHLNSDVECEMCKQVIKIVDEILEDNATEAEVEKALEKACLQLPQSLVDMCKTEIMQFVPIIFKYIDNIGDPNFICIKIKLCPTTTGHLDFVGANPCTYGPSYWCKSVYAAKSCGAIEHCRNHVWNL